MNIFEGFRDAIIATKDVFSELDPHVLFKASLLMHRKPCLMVFKSQSV